MAKQSKELTGFYDAYLAWAEGGPNPSGAFREIFGMCFNLGQYVQYVARLHWSEEIALGREMKAQFYEALLDPAYPFESMEEYNAADDKRKNEARMAWVRAHSSNGELA